MEATEVTIETLRDDGSLGEVERDDLLDRVRADDHEPRRDPAALDRRASASRSRTSTRPTSATSTTSSTTTRRRQSASTTGSSASTRGSPGSTRSPPTRRASRTTRCRARSPTSPTSSRGRCNVLATDLRPARPAGPRRLALRLQLGSRTRTPSRPAPSRPTRSRPQFRDDYVHNGNDSHWLTNPEAPLTGFDRIIGIENAERTPRTRIGLIQVEDRLAGTDGLPGDGLRPQDARAGDARQPRITSASSGATSWSASAGPRRGGTLIGKRGPVDVGEACDVLAQLGSPRRPRLERGRCSSGASSSTCSANFRSLPTGLQGGTLPGADTICGRRRTQLGGSGQHPERA